MTDCRFEENVAGTCGGVQTLEAELVATRCTFSKNSSQEPGAAFRTEDGSLVLTDCGFDGNVPTAIAMIITITIVIIRAMIIAIIMDSIVSTIIAIIIAIIIIIIIIALIIAISIIAIPII